MGEGLYLRADLMADGLTERELRALRRAGALDPVRPGAYVAAGEERAGLDPTLRHWYAVHAAVRRLGLGTVVSHTSAAVLHGLPLWFPPGAPPGAVRVHVTRDRRSGARRSAHVDMHAASLRPDEVVAVDGVLTTSVARTLADIARTESFGVALVPADAALHRHLVVPADLVEALDRGGRRKGNSAARRVLGFADGRAESPGESRSRLAIHLAGLPEPELQHVVHIRDGRSCRVDFWWSDGVVGEFDGRVKYGRLLKPGQEPGDAVFAEKVREDALRAEGLRVVRWTWRDLTDFAPVAARLRHALS
jgi:hypothetical protein